MKNILLITITLFTVSVNAQVLYNDNFDNYTLGNLGTDPDGYVQGQGGWLTGCWYTKSNGFFNIVNEANRGKVLDLTSNLTKKSEVFGLIKPNIDVLIDTRLPGNDVIKFEIDFFTGNQMAIEGISRIRLSWKDMDPLTGDYIFQLFFLKRTGEIQGHNVLFNNGQGTISFIREGNNGVYLPFVTWITFVVYLDYPNNKIYIEIPYLNKVFSSSLRDKNTNIQDFKPIAVTMATSFQANMNYNVFSSQRYDNIKITAFNAVPQGVIDLSNDDFLSDKFNMYPNPATNSVTITNNENMLVKEVALYDTTGKLISTQSFNDETEIQLNVENLASGTYMLHLQTNEGTAVKKLVKK